MESTLKKIVVIGNQKVELFSIDGSCWSSDLAQLQKRIQEREREQKNSRRSEAVFENSTRLVKKNGAMKICLPVSKIEFELTPCSLLDVVATKKNIASINRSKWYGSGRVSTMLNRGAGVGRLTLERQSQTASEEPLPLRLVFSRLK
jgi:hypothetical protein